MSHPRAALPITVAEVDVGAEIIRVELKLFNGRPMFSAWRFYNKDGEFRPARHGLACSIERLSEIAKAFADAVERAREAGLL